MTKNISSSELLLKAIEKEAEKDEKRILETASERKRERLSKLRAQIKSESRERILRALSECTKTANEKCSEISAKERMQTKEIRQKTVDTVLLRVQQKTADFSESAAYAEFLLACARHVKEQFGEGCTLYMREKDSVYSQTVSKVLGACEIKCDEGIKLGGFKARYTQLHIEADETLDARFDIEKKEYIKQCGFDF